MCWGTSTSGVRISIRRVTGKSQEMGVPLDEPAIEVSGYCEGGDGIAPPALADWLIATISPRI
jgi:hypothetical protein